MEGSNSDKQLHTPSVAMFNTHGIDMSTVVTELTYQNHDEEYSHKPIFNMSELATVTKPPPIKPHQHESYQK